MPLHPQDPAKKPHPPEHRRKKTHPRRASHRTGTTRKKRSRPQRAGSSGIRQASADRKSTRLNSSHSQISYAVFCLKKKKNKNSVKIARAIVIYERDTNARV